MLVLPVYVRWQDVQLSEMNCFIRFASLCQALQTEACKVARLELRENQITDVGVAGLCQVLKTPKCKVTYLYLNHNQVTDTGVATLCQTLQRAQ